MQSSFTRKSFPWFIESFKPVLGSCSGSKHFLIEMTHLARITCKTQIDHADNSRSLPLIPPYCPWPPSASWEHQLLLILKLSFIFRISIENWCPGNSEIPSSQRWTSLLFLFLFSHSIEKSLNQITSELEWTIKLI